MSSGLDLEPLLETTRAINAVIVSSLAAVDERLSVPQLRVMVILSARNEAGLSLVAEELGVNASNVSRTCEQLVRRGLVVRDTDSADRRRVALSLSADGKRLLRRVMDRRMRLLSRIVDAMQTDEQRDLMHALEAFNAAAGKVGTTDRGAVSSRTLPWVE